MSLELDILHQLADIQHCSRWVIAYSGGLDSTVLVHLLAKKIPPTQCRPLHLIHINHRLSGNANHWQAHCECLASQLHIPLTAHGVTVTSIGQGVEAAARDARYRIFSAFLKPGDCLLTGHHRDDQAETVLLRLFRGAGASGLAAIPRRRSLAAGQLLRPLLGVGRQQLVDYALREGLSWIDDDSNASVTFDRNFIRLQVLPLIKQRWPAVSRQLARTAELMQRAQYLQSEVARDDLAEMDERNERCGYSLPIAQLRQLTPTRIDNLMRYWSALYRYPVPHYRHLQQLRQQLQFAAAAQKNLVIRWADTEWRSFRGRLYLQPVQSISTQSTPTQSAVKTRHRPVVAFDWTLVDSITLPDGSCLSARPTSGSGLLVAGKQCQIRWRLGGERCRPLGRRHSQTLKKLLQEYGVETWLRQRIPLVYLDDELAAVADLWICHDFAAAPGQRGVELHWRLS